jgi:hypothetical protein
MVHRLDGLPRGIRQGKETCAGMVKPASPGPCDFHRHCAFFLLTTEPFTATVGRAPRESIMLDLASSHDNACFDALSFGPNRLRLLFDSCVRPFAKGHAPAR